MADDHSPAHPGAGPAVPTRERRHPLSRPLRVGVFAGVLAGGVFGFLIAFSVMRLTCGDHLCAGLQPFLWGVGGAVVGLAGTAVVAVLVARSFGEWAMLREGRRRADGEGDPASPGDA